jgi:D-beta-D-heptose 7-phosphate kinase/D-beta-D-heptose 1-phosphate adenosyltransferase
MKTVFVNGTFDILHVGHLALLSYAKSLGDEVVVAIDSDIRVKQLKGNDRPINTQSERGALLAALKDVDRVYVFDTDEELIDLMSKCDIIVKGSDYEGKKIVGQEVCRELIFFKRIDGFSTTEKIAHISNR